MISEPDLEHLRSEINRDPRAPDGYRKLAAAHGTLKRPEDRFLILKGAREKCTGTPDLLLDLAEASIALRFSDDAITAATEALESEQLDADQKERAGRVFVQTGKLEDANSIFEDLFADNPLHASALETLAGLARDDDLADILDSARAVQPESLEKHARSVLHFGLARLNDRMDRTREAFQHFDTANALANSSNPTVAEFLAVATPQLIQAFQTLPEIRPRDIDAEPRDIFILGLPRSGSTLLEQVLMRHTGAGSLGESTALMDSVDDVNRELGGLSMTNYAARLGSGSAAKIRANYDDRTKLRRSRNGVLINQMQMNFFYYGFLRAAFPDAIVITLTREPMDVAWSCFQQNFPRALDWAFSFDRIAQFMACHSALMDHWQSVDRGVALIVNYEQFVTQHDEALSSLLQTAGLRDISTKTESPLKTVASTASAIQVRSTVTSFSIGKWQRYGTVLGPLEQALRDHRLLT